MTIEKSKIKKIILIIIVIGIFVAIDLLPYNKGYFKSDVDVFQNAIKKYNLYIGLFFLIISSITLIFYVLTEKFKRKSNLDKKDFIVGLSIYIVIFTLSLIVSADEIVTNISLLINKNEAKGNIVRDYEVAYYDNDEQLLTVLDDDFDKVALNNKTYELIKNDTIIKVKFDIGILKIPYNPRYYIKTKDIQTKKNKNCP